MSMVRKIDGVPIDRITVSHLANNLLLVNVEQNVIEGRSEERRVGKECLL